MAHSDCGRMCGCAGETVRFLENTCHIPERFCGGVSLRRGAISSVCTFTLYHLRFCRSCQPPLTRHRVLPPPAPWRLCRRSGWASDAIAKWERMAIAFAVNGLMIVSGNPGAISRTARLRERANDNASSIWVSLHHTGPRPWRRCGTFR